jgi:uncharacterized protein (TIGR02231 family)
MNKVYSKTELSHVTIYNQGANIERKGVVEITKGANELVIQNVSPYLINESIQIVILSKNVIINSVRKQINYLGANPPTKEIVILKDSLKKLKDLKRDHAINLEVFTQEKDLLDENKSVLKLSKEFIIDDLMDLTDYFRERMLNIESNLSETRHNLAKLNKEIKKIDNQLISTSNKINNQFSNIIVQLTSKEKGSYNYELSYNLNNAGWSPYYDIRSKEINSLIDLTYRAKVYQKSNENWGNVNLSLSTGSLNQSNKAPSFHPQYISYNNYQQTKRKERSNLNKNYSAEITAFKSDDINDQPIEEVSSSASEFTTVKFNGTQIEYNIDLPYSIPSNKQPILIDIQNISLLASYDYYCYPKIDKDVFLMCHFSSIANQNFLPGNAQVFFEGKSIGKTYLDPLSTKSTIDLSLGRDVSILVERKLLKKYSSEIKIGDKIKLERSFELTIKNNKTDSISIKLIDQIPLSNNKSNSVELTEKSNASFKKQNGKLIWNLNLSSGEILKKKFNYLIKHPQDKVIRGLN